MLSSRICSSPKTRPMVWNHPSGRHLVSPQAGYSWVGLKAGFSHRFPHHTLPRELQTQFYDIASFPAISCSLFASPLFWKFAHFCTLAKLLQNDCSNLRAAQKPRIKRPYDLRDLPSLPSSRKIQFVRPWPASSPFISYRDVPWSRITIVSPGPLLSHRTAPD